MIYRPRWSRRLWDSWLFEWEGRYHLFFLETQASTWDHVGHAVSTDLVHWEDHPSIPTKGPAGAWNGDASLTGMVVRHEELFYMFVGAQHNGVQVVGVYTSRDLERWTLHPASPVMKPAGPYYLEKPQPPFLGHVDWRDPCISYRKEDGYYHAYLCARLPKWSHEDSGAAVGHMRSKDLIHWEHLPPLATPGKVFYHTEVPDVFEMNGRYYLAFATHSTGGIRLNSPTRDDAVGTFYMIGDKFEGPFTLPADPLLIGSGNRSFFGYVGRTIPHQGGRLLYHHIAADRPAIGAPKMIGVNADGTLRVEYMPVLEKLETKVLVDSVHNIPPYQTGDLGQWQQQDDMLSGLAAVMGTSYVIGREVSDVHVCATIKVSEGGAAGFVVRGWQNYGFSVVINLGRQRLEIGQASKHPTYKMGWTCGITDICRMRLEPNRAYQLRCFARDEHFEVYLDNRWVFTVVMGGNKQGDVELMVESGRAEFSDVRLAALEPLA